MQQREEGLRDLVNHVLRDQCGQLIEESDLLSQERTLNTAKRMWWIFTQDKGLRAQMLRIEAKIDAGRVSIRNPVSSLQECIWIEAAKKHAQTDTDNFLMHHICP